VLFLTYEGFTLDRVSTSPLSINMCEAVQVVVSVTMELELNVLFQPRYLLKDNLFTIDADELLGLAPAFVCFVELFSFTEVQISHISGI
jgi:hypothetical protein